MGILAILDSATDIFDVTSTFSAAITAYLYFWLPNVQDSHGTCVFHFSLNIALMQAFYFLYAITARLTIMTRLYDMVKYCMGEVYVLNYLIFTVQTWSVILSYNTWREIKQLQCVNHQTYPRRRLNIYRLLGYGVPILYLVFRVILLQSFIDPENSHYYCFYRAKSFQWLPSLSSFVLNVFYFADSQRRLWNLLTGIQEFQNENPPSRSFMTALKYKMFLNIELCLTMNIPFGLSTFIHIIVVVIGLNYYDSLIVRLEIINFFLASLQGTFIFLVAVAFRKRVIKGFIKYGNKTLVGFIRVPTFLRPSADDDVEETDDNDGGEAPLRQNGGNKDETQARIV